MLEDQQSIPETSDKASQKHKKIDTHDVESPRRYQSVNTDEEWYVKPRLWCARCHRKKKKKYRELELGTRRLLGRVRQRCKESEKSDDEAGVSSAPHRESISRPSGPEKSMRSRKQDSPAEVADKDVTGKRRKERKRDEQEERRRRERKERERQERRERREREKRIPPVVDEQPAAQPKDFLQSCCYLCAQNTLAIAAAAKLKPQQSDKCVQVSAHQFHPETPALDKSCSTTLLFRTVQSSVKVRTRETSTLCPGMSAQRRHTENKRKKLSVFPRLTWTKCPVRRHVACETDKSARRDNAEKRERARNEKCCAEKKNT